MWLVITTPRIGISRRPCKVLVFQFAICLCMSIQSVTKATYSLKIDTIFYPRAASISSVAISTAYFAFNLKASFRNFTYVIVSIELDIPLNSHCYIQSIVCSSRTCFSNSVMKFFTLSLPVNGFMGKFLWHMSKFSCTAVGKRRAAIGSYLRPDRRIVFGN